jgi:GntR family transcriptional regulator/MocR family aminotransferase
MYYRTIVRMPIGRTDLRRHSGSHLGAAIAAALEASIDEGRLAPGERLPTVRGLAAHLGVSPATIAVAYDELARRGRTRGEVGRGTFVRGAAPAGGGSTPRVRQPDAEPRASGAPAEQRTPWRRRLQSQSAARLLGAHPGSIDCASGGPDVQLLPLRVLKRAWTAAIAATEPIDLQYGTPEPVGELADAVADRLARDGIEVGPRQIAVGASALQLIELALRAAVRRAGWRDPLVAVEQPGYATVLDAVDRLGWPMVGVAIDAEGAVPESLAAALRAGARIVILTPRSLNPTGASWSPARRSALAAVLAGAPDAVVVEDDHAADAVLSAPVSLFTEPLLRSRVVHVRSFSKAIAPDLRVAVAIAGPSLRGLIVEEKGYVDGWTSRVAQRALARVLRDPELPALLSRAAHAYARRREAAVEGLTRSELVAAGGSVAPAADGMNVWVTLPPGVDEAAVLERLAAAGWVGTPGECFDLLPGSTGQLRLTVSGLDPDSAAAAGAALGAAAAELAGVGAMVGAAT